MRAISYEALCRTSLLRYPGFKFLGKNALMAMQELMATFRAESRQIESWHLDFSEVALPTPSEGWEKNRLESGNSTEQARAYERFQAQKDAQAAAMLVVKELHLASNAENAVNGTSCSVLLASTA